VLGQYGGRRFVGLTRRLWSCLRCCRFCGSATVGRFLLGAHRGSARSFYDPTASRCRYGALQRVDSYALYVGVSPSCGNQPAEVTS
jgi:hypothetical protein